MTSVVGVRQTYFLEPCTKKSARFFVFMRVFSVSLRHKKNKIMEHFITKLYGKEQSLSCTQKEILDASYERYQGDKFKLLNLTRGSGFTTFMVNWSFVLASAYGYNVSYFVPSEHDILEIGKKLLDFSGHDVTDMIGGSKEIHWGKLNVERSVRDKLKFSCGDGHVSFYVAQYYNLIGMRFTNGFAIFDSADFYDRSMDFFRYVSCSFMDAKEIIVASCPNPNAKFSESWFQRTWMDEDTKFKKYKIKNSLDSVDFDGGMTEKLFDFYFNNAEEYFASLSKELKNNNTNENKPMKEHVNHPEHYNLHPSGVECIEIAKHYDFCIGNAIKYLWRCGLKSEEGMTDREKEIEDLEKAVWYINERIRTLKA